MGPLHVVFSLLGIVLLAVVVYIQVLRRKLVDPMKSFNPIPISRIPELFRLNFNSKVEDSKVAFKVIC